MNLDDNTLHELALLMQFPDSSSLAGLKVHSDANADTVAAAARLHDKGLTTQRDGGYLTPFGHEARELGDKLLAILR
ncbi:TIGR02647 family protein [Gammaproteobacteria bacterium LSUCC0057]|uniref:TIGR02647 family protein n=1 Tax=Gammaproteobacteria bacterium LSUCC0057 TaxID=2559237 RepID=A0A4Y8UI99_9GAMM|nr:TIGR02647 family protein [Gammaproteobacteria bacterium LSUCC0057]